MKLLRVAAMAAACIVLAGCASSPQSLLKTVEALNDGCDKVVDINLAYVAPMPPSGTVRITKNCSADKRAGAIKAGEMIAAPDLPAT